MKRKDVLTTITANISETGKASNVEIRMYIENKISYAAFQKAVQKGMQFFKERKLALETHNSEEMVDGEAFDYLWK